MPPPRRRHDDASFRTSFGAALAADVGDDGETGGCEERGELVIQRVQSTDCIIALADDEETMDERRRFACRVEPRETSAACIKVMPRLP